MIAVGIQADGEVVGTHVGGRFPQAIDAPELPPRFIDRHDESAGIQQGDVGRKAVEDGRSPGCVDAAHVLLRALQHEGTAIAVGDCIDLPGGQFVQALLPAEM